MASRSDLRIDGDAQDGKTARETIDAERKKVIKHYQHRRREAGEEIVTSTLESSVTHSSNNSGPEDNPRDNIDAERKQIIEDYERREREIKGQGDRAVV